MSEQTVVESSENSNPNEISSTSLESNLNENNNDASNNNSTKSKKIAKNNTGKKKGTMSPSSNSNVQTDQTNKKPNLKQMTLTEIAMNVSPKLKVPLNSSSPKITKESSESNNENLKLKQEANEAQIDTNKKSSKDNEAADNENNNKLSFSKRNIVKILGCNYNNNKQLIFAVQLKKPTKLVYVPYLDLKKRCPQTLCDYLESLISFD